MLRRALSALRFKKGDKEVSYRVAKDEYTDEVVVETWSGSWTSVSNAGAAFVGVLREAGMDSKQIEDILKHALQVNGEADGDGEASN